MFKKYNLADNAVANLDAGINASTTTITLTLGTGVIFPASNFIGTLVQYNTPADPTSGIAKSEKVLVSSRSSDILTVTRGFDGDTGTSFLAGDFLYLNVVAEITKDIQDEVTRLENDKLDISEYNSTTRDDLTPYRLLFIDSTGAETQLALGTAGQVLISQGATNNPIWQVPSVDIAGLTEDTVGDMDIDDFVKRDGTGNKKIKINRYRASDAEATAGTSTKKFMTPKQAKDNYFGFTQGLASNALQGSSDSVVQNTTTTFTKVKEIRIRTDIAGTVRVVFDLRNLEGVSSDGRIYINGTGVGTTRTTSSTTFITYTEDISYNPGDLIQIFTRNASGGVTNEVRNFRLSFDIQRVGFTQVII